MNLTGLRDDIDTVSSDLDDLEARSVIEDKFYVNRDPFFADDGFSCYDPFTIDAGNVLDLAANFTLQELTNVQNGIFRARLTRNGQVVARAFDDRGLPAGSTGIDNNHQVTLLYRNRVPTTSDFQLCIRLSLDIDQTQGRKTFQWGYKVWGSGYQIDFDDSEEPS